MRLVIILVLALAVPIAGCGDTGTSGTSGVQGGTGRAPGAPPVATQPTPTRSPAPSR